MGLESALSELVKNLPKQESRKNIGTNPCVLLYGHGPEGKKCKECAELYAKQYAGKYFKCKVRGDNGVKTDHRVRWNACAKFKPITEPV